MKLIVTDGYEKMTSVAFEIFRNALTLNPSINLGLATGSTPIGLYSTVSASFLRGEISFEKVKTFNLDEYVGLSKDDKNSYAFFMRDKLFSHVDIKPENVHIPDGSCPDPETQCEIYAKLLKDNGRDLQLLGLGENGHIGFNEPGTPFDSTTHVVTLTESTIKANSRLFENKDEVPKKAITMGIKEITSAKEIVLLVSGENKARALRETLIGEISVLTPSTALRLCKNVTVIADKSATKLL